MPGLFAAKRGDTLEPENLFDRFADVFEILGIEAAVPEKRAVDIAPPDMRGADIAPLDMRGAEIPPPDIREDDAPAELRGPAMATEAAKQIAAINPKRSVFAFI